MLPFAQLTRRMRSRHASSARQHGSQGLPRTLIPTWFTLPPARRQSYTPAAGNECRTSCAAFTYTASSAMFVAWSPMRSMLRAIKIKSR